MYLEATPTLLFQNFASMRFNKTEVLFTVSLITEINPTSIIYKFRKTNISLMLINK